MRIVIAEDNVLLSAGLELLLSTRGHEVVEVAGDAEAFSGALERHRPDLAIVDVRLPPRFRDEGIHAAIEARRRYEGLPVLVLSQYVERDYAGELLADGRGGVGYLLKDRVGRVGEFVDALRRVADGGTVMDPEVVRQLLAERARDPLEALTRREREVLALMAEGLGNGEIAERIVVTENAVHKHIGNIFAKLGLAPTDTGHRRVRAVLAYLERR
ncbi:LuxR family two component transcriptional regulator [Nocardiopsis sp. Huas11]|uniref:LuxR C-terminal-related transcriptional regulator n=1 Tax=Nocardiopsis sp. Huas11 TaxID=2183912 RepID=UPI000EB0291F|nr:response regulator transcription factor [Nocardiopsis sp. Huas11]RKS10602.1 LuxR family two component transcriptional regulator [Nocardiopsis sp. Huas11]